MFRHHCDACGRREPIFASQLTGARNTPQGIVVSFECWCGAPQSVLTGRAADAARVAVAA